MSPDGDIYSPEQVAALKKREQEMLVPIPDGDLARVKAMPREQRKVWYRDNRASLRAKIAQTSTRAERLADQAESRASRRPERIIDADERRKARNRRKAA